MSYAELQTLLDDYRTWLKDDGHLEEVDGYIKITTPFVDRHNDFIQIYARKEGERWYLTDDGYTIRDLKSSGCDISSRKRNQLLQVTLNRFGVDREGNDLSTSATSDQFPIAKHTLIQAIISVGDLFYTSRATVIGLFLDEVASWLDSLEVRYVPEVKFGGRSGFDYKFDFVIPRSNGTPERILQTVNRPGRASIERLMMAWEDTSSTRGDKAKAYAVLNDKESNVSDSNLQALENYKIHPIKWSRREEFAEHLAA